MKIKSFGSQSFILGLGIAALTYFLGPTISKKAKNAAKGVQGAALAGEASMALKKGKEKIKNYFQQTPVQKQLQDEQIDPQMKQILTEIRQDRQHLNTTLEELKSKIQTIEDEISELKENQGK